MLINKKDLLGSFAKYAVIQSPYTCPDNINQIIEDLDEALTISVYTKENSCLGMVEVSRIKLSKILDIIFEGVESIRNLNESKLDLGDVYTTIPTDYYHNPDNDFIDICALRQNIVREVCKESEELEIRRRDTLSRIKRTKE